MNISSIILSGLYEDFFSALLCGWAFSVLKTHYFAGTTSGVYDCRMFRSVGAGSNIPKGLSSRRAVPTLSGTNSNILLRMTACT